MDMDIAIFDTRIHLRRLKTTDYADWFVMLEACFSIAGVPLIAVNLDSQALSVLVALTDNYFTT
jgi:hypothetical protein